MSKSLLNEYCQKAHLDYPRYTPERVGDLFVCCVVVDGEEFRGIEGHSTKKEAEQDAARVVLNNLVQLHREASNIQELLACVEKEQKGGGGMGQSYSDSWVGGGGGGSVGGEPQPKVPDETSSLPSPAAILPQPPQTVPVSASSSRVPSLNPPPGSPLQAVVPPSVMSSTQSSPLLPNQVSVSSRQAPQNYSSSPSSTSSSQPVQMVPAHTLSVPLSVPAPQSLGSSTVPIAYTAPQGIPIPTQPLNFVPASPVKVEGARVVSSTPQSASQSPDARKSPHLLQQLLSSPASSPPANQQSQSAGRAPPPRTHSTPQHGRPFSSLAISFSPQSPPPTSSSSVSNTSSPADPQNRQPSSVRLNPARAPSFPPVSSVTAPIRAQSEEHRTPVANVPFNPRPPSNSSATSSTIVVEPEYNFVKILETYCIKSNCHLPMYSIMQKEKRYSATIMVRNLLFRGTRSHETFDAAREHVTLVALACLGIRALGLNDSGGGVAGGVVRGVAAAPSLAATSLPPHPVHSLPVSILSRGSSENSCDSSSHSETPVPGAAALPRATAAAEAAATPQGPPSLPRAPAVSNPTVPKLHPPSFFKGSSPSEKAAVPGSYLPNIPQGTVSPAVLDLMAVENYKTALNTYCQQNHLAPPRYDCTYPEDEVGYIVVIHVEGKHFKSTPQGTKRGAESMAASLALESLGISVDTEGKGEVRNGTHHGGALHQPPQITEAERNISYKNLLQEYLQKSNSSLPSYQTERESDRYVSLVSIKLPPDGKSRTFRGKPHANKKAAEQESAKKACLEMGIVRA